LTKYTSNSITYQKVHHFKNMSFFQTLMSAIATHVWMEPPVKMVLTCTRVFVLLDTLVSTVKTLVGVQFMSVISNVGGFISGVLKSPVQRLG
jgi:hypothetical protein